MKTPVVLTIFNRPQTTVRVMEVLQRMRPEHLLVVADGPRAGKAGDEALCRETRRIAESVTWPCELRRDYAETNLGCRKRMSTGLDAAFREYEEAIILEDDCVPDDSFFAFCEEMLARYRDHPDVGLVSGTNSQYGVSPTNASYYFSCYPLIWGWATWRHTWSLYDVDIPQWPDLRETGWLEETVGSGYRAAYWQRLFDSVRNGFDTWDYSLVFTCWLHGQLAVHPSRDLVSNIGFGENATHTRDPSSPRANIPAATMAFPLVHPAKVAADVQADARIEHHLFSGNLRQQFAAVRSHLRRNPSP